MNEWEIDQLIKRLRETRREDLEDLKSEIEEYLDLRLSQLRDHEPRIRVLEKTRSFAIGAAWVITGLGGIIGLLKLIGVLA
jgi:type VI protein secretion system component VasK